MKLHLIGIAISNVYVRDTVSLFFLSLILYSFINLLYYFGGVNIFCILHILKMLWQYLIKCNASKGNLNLCVFPK